MVFPDTESPAVPIIIMEVINMKKTIVYALIVVLLASMVTANYCDDVMDELDLVYNTGYKEEFDFKAFPRKRNCE